MNIKYTEPWKDKYDNWRCPSCSGRLNDKSYIIKRVGGMHCVKCKRIYKDKGSRLVYTGRKVFAG